MERIHQLINVNFDSLNRSFMVLHSLAIAFLVWGYVAIVADHVAIFAVLIASVRPNFGPAPGHLQPELPLIWEGL